MSLSSPRGPPDLLTLPHLCVCVQVVDTPGILDHPLEERNTIEMQAITALAHLRAAVLYVMDVSEQCGHTLQEQLELFSNIRPLFANKVRRLRVVAVFLFFALALTVMLRPLQPLIVVANKCDVKKLSELSGENQVGVYTLIIFIFSLCCLNFPVKCLSCLCQKIFADLSAEGIPVIETSTLTEEGVMQVKTEVRNGPPV